MRVAIVHDWLVTWRGGEKVLEAIASLYPDAPIYTLFYDSAKMPASITGRQVIVHRSANRLRFLRKALLPLMPLWIESFSLEHYDLVISTSSCVAKGALVGPQTKHLSYIHSPMRYVWDQRDEYLGRVRTLPIIGLMIEAGCAILRLWDAVSSGRVNTFVANSRFVKLRIEKYYGRDAVVVHPPIEVARFKPPHYPTKGGYLLAAGAFVGYKRFDLAIKACEQLGRKLIVAGDGPELKRLKGLSGKNTSFRIRPSDEEWVQLLQGADALLFPGVEDFGMVAVEAMAAGTPVIAFKSGGALDFIIEETTGIFFMEPTARSLAQAIERHTAMTWNREALSRHAEAFNKEAFLKGIRRQLEILLSQ
ncbi:MAG: glycosyltransferase [Proteobacteria bacterium]|nr:glycosyltransferase [Pseudomonadota bacterium]